MISTNPAVRWFLAVLTAVATPAFLASVALVIGSGLLVAGVYTLAGIGWALLTGAIPCLLVGFILLRGVVYGG